MKNKSFLINLIITLVASAIVFCFCQFNLLEKIELRFYDGLSHLTKDPEMSDDILLLAITDQDINELGDWPWSRDILADSLIRMKELGAKQAVFDIEYISKSPKAVASNAETKINQKISETEDLSKELIQSIPLVIQGGTPVEESPMVAQEFIQDYLEPAYSDLYDFVNNNVAADNDEYFARACQFFGNTWLTTNIIDLGYTYITKEDIDYIGKRMMKYQIDDPENYIEKNNKYTIKESYGDENGGFTPALQTMIKRAAGIGYTNSNVDVDGIRRRNELFYKYNGKYVGQLVFGPLMSVLDAKSFTRTKNSLIIHDALYPGETKRVDVTIPLDNHGRMLINWQHEADPETQTNLYGTDFANVYFLNNLDKTESNIFINLNRFLEEEYNIIDYEGYEMPHITHARELIEYYQDLLNYKEYLLSLCTGYDENNQPYDGISDEEYASYFAERENYFKCVKEFVDLNYQDELNEYLSLIFNDDESGISFINDINEIFNSVKSDINEYFENFAILKEKFNGKYCIIGQTAASTTDIGATPFVKQYYNVCIHANVMNTVLTRNFITPYPWYIGFFVTFLLSLALLFLNDTSSTIQNSVGAVVRILEMLVFVLIFITKRIYIPMLTSVILYNLFDYFIGLITRYLKSSKEKKFITAVASSFANKDTVEQLRKNPELFKTEGEKKYITALFSDIQKFSTFSETITKMHPEDGANRLIALLNEYLGAMSNEILKNSGNIDKYEGDAIISMFGAPDPMNIHNAEEWAYASLDSAIRMKKCEIEFNESHKELFAPMEIVTPEGEKQILQLNPFQTRIGLNSGYANVGLMGSKTESFSKLNYTMIGDTVNLASRLEGVNKPYKSWIMCSDETWKKANTGKNEGKIIVRMLDQVRVVGRKTPVQLYNVVGFKDELKPEIIESIEIFNAAYDKYLQRDFINAGKMFMQASALYENDGTSLVLANRCKEYIENGLPENWDGILNMTEK